MSDGKSISAEMLEVVRYGDDESRSQIIEMQKEIEKHRIEVELSKVKDIDKYENKKFNRTIFSEIVKKIDPKIYLWTLIFILMLFNSKNMWIYLTRKLH
jgi:SPX domain protein involved in polyphosphate accumulation